VSGIAAAISAIAAAVAAFISLTHMRRQEAAARRTNLEDLHESLSALRLVLDGAFVRLREFGMMQRSVGRHLATFRTGIPAVDAVASVKPASNATSEGQVITPEQVQELKNLTTNALAQVAMLLERS
jgi:hypothetical protein